MNGGHPTTMIGDLLIAAIIVVIAAVLGIIVHPLLWFILIVAVLWLFARRGSWSRSPRRKLAETRRAATLTHAPSAPRPE